MLLHLRPRLFSLQFGIVSVVDMEIPSLGLRLLGNVDLTTRRPYPNKHYAVACRKRGHKAVDGIFIDTGEPVEHIDCITRWAIDAKAVVTHRVRYTLLDRDFDSASDHMLLWWACSDSLGGWSDRHPRGKERFLPVQIEPVMELIEARADRPNAHDTFDETLGWIALREQTFEMPTIERERLLNSELNHRLPAITDVFSRA
jgi:hypothetical protein